MKREQKMGIFGLFFVGFFIVSPVFQNCAKTKYDTFDPNAGLAGSGASRKLTIDPTYNQQKANLKVLFVVDDSYTMSQSQSQLANAIDSLLTPLQGHNVSFKVVSTSGVPSNEVDYNLTTTYMTESRLVIPQSQTTGLGSYLIQRTVTNNSNRHPTLQLLRTSTTAQFNQTKNQIKSTILAAGVNGSDTEEGLCAVARQLFDTASGSFFKAGDKAAVVILTDENDASDFSKCVTRYVQRVSAQSVVYYTYGQQRAKVSLEYQLTRDGVTDWYPVIWGVPLSGAQTVTNGANCSNSDLNYAVNRITSQGYIIRNVGTCVYETVPASYYGSDIGDDGTDINKNLCSSQVRFNNTNYVNLYAMVNAIGYSAQSGSCSKQVLPGNSLSQYIEYDSVIRADLAATSAQNISSAIHNKSVELFGSSGFTVASLIRKFGESCTLNSGQSYGTNYEALSQLLGPSNSVVESLCAASFSSTLSQVSNFIVNEANLSYVIPNLLSNERISSVIINRGSQRLVLSASQYEVIGSTLTLTNFNLQAGDTMELEIVTQ